MDNNLIDNRIIRIFISSTFRDMQDERDYLVKKVFPVLKEKAAQRDVTVIPLDLRWGITEQESKNGKVLEICLNEIDNSFPFFIGIIGNRYGWCPTKEEIKCLHGKFDDIVEEINAGLSVTEIEMQYGVLKNPRELNAYFFIKHEEDPTLETENPEKLKKLKDAIRQNGKYPVSEYTSAEDLGSQVEAAFKSLLDSLFPQRIISEAERERWRHQVYLNHLCQFYVPDIECFDKLSVFLEGDYRTCAVGGDAGVGKSALVANWINTRIDLSQYIVVYHLAGAGESGNTAESILNRIKKEIESNPDKKSIIILDGLWSNLDLPEAGSLMTQLAHSDRINKIICIDRYEEDTGESDLYITPTPHFDTNYWRGFIREYLHVYRKRLTARQMNRIVANPLIHNYLILKTLLNEIISYGSFEKLDEHIDLLCAVNTKEEFYQEYLSLLEKEHGRDIISLLLSCLVLSEYGLTEDAARNITELPPLKWSQIYCNIKENLLVSEEGLRLMSEDLSSAIRDRYELDNAEIARPLRESIVKVFEGDYSALSFSEKCFQLHLSGRYADLYQLLTDNYPSYSLTEHAYFSVLFDTLKIELSRWDGMNEEQLRFTVSLLSKTLPKCFSSPDLVRNDVLSYKLRSLISEIPFLIDECRLHEENGTLFDRDTLESLKSVVLKQFEKN